MTPVEIDAIHYGIAFVSFLVGSFSLTAAISPPHDDPRTEATLYGTALFFVAVGFVVGLHQ